MILSNGAEEYANITTGLETLTDTQLQEYYDICIDAGNRTISVLDIGMDTKFMYHILRLALECEQILIEHDLDIERNSEILKSVRRGEWKIDDIKTWFTEKERVLQNLYVTSTLQHKPDEESIKRLLVECLEMHYGSLDKAVVMQNDSDKLATEMFTLLNKFGYYK